MLTGSEATLNAAKTTVHLIGDVHMRSSDGLSAVTDEASYADADGFIRMPGRTKFTRNGMGAAGDGAEYDRNADLLQLLSSAEIELVSHVPPTRIVSRAATVAQTEGYMRFEDGVAINTGTHQIMAGSAFATLLDESTQLEALELMQDARLIRTEQQPGTLREMTADLKGNARLEMATSDGEAGSQISSTSMQLAFDSDGREINELVARKQVRLVLPQRVGSPIQTVTADLLTVTSPTGKGIELARFEGKVKFKEVVHTTGREPNSRVTRAQRLNATLSEGLTRISGTRFIGEVRFDDGRVVGLADEAIYAIDEGQVELVTSETEGRTPRVETSRGSVQASKITLNPNDNSMAAEGDVESVLVTKLTVDKSDDGAGLPALLQPIEPVYVTSGQLTYDGNTETTIYTQEARLWQASTQFYGDRIVLEEGNRNISAEGDVRTRWLVKQVNSETGLQEESVTNGQAQRFTFDDALQTATYTTEAQIASPRANMTADVIRLFFLSDGRTLERVEAEGNVELNVPGRLAFGESLAYYDGEGRYTMEGEPVRITEESEQQCRETTGRNLTFFLAGDAVSVDGESEIRTETSQGPCAELTQ